MSRAQPRPLRALERAHTQWASRSRYRLQLRVLSLDEPFFFCPCRVAHGLQKTTKSQKRSLRKGEKMRRVQSATLQDAAYKSFTGRTHSLAREHARSHTNAESNLLPHLSSSQRAVYAAFTAHVVSHPRCPASACNRAVSWPTLLPLFEVRPVSACVRA